MLGQVVGNYVVKEKIGEGGMGSVYLAEHRRISRSVAIKVMHPNAARNPELAARFLNEARAASKIGGENVVQILDFGELETGEPFIAMEWLEGETLRSLLARTPRPGLRQMIDVLKSVANALEAAHALGIVHRDLKPDNIFLVRQSSGIPLVKVLDFGIAKILEQQAEGGFKTQTGALLGTPAYMAPEQCTASKSLDHRCDIYALGVIAFQMLTGRLPFVADNWGELLVAQMTQDPPVPSQIAPGTSQPVSDAILRALAKSPGLRFASAKEFVNTLSVAALSQLEVGADPLRTLDDAVWPVVAPTKIVTTMSSSVGELQPTPRNDVARTLKQRLVPYRGWAAVGIGLVALAFAGTFLGTARSKTEATQSASQAPASPAEKPSVRPLAQPSLPLVTPILRNKVKPAAVAPKRSMADGTSETSKPRAPSAHLPQPPARPLPTPVVEEAKAPRPSAPEAPATVPEVIPKARSPKHLDRLVDPFNAAIPAAPAELKRRSKLENL